YLPYDNKHVPPTITLAASFPLNPAEAEENKPVFIRARALDDVQVRQVDFYLNGKLAATSGSYPFEFAFQTGALSLTNQSFRVRAVAIDTGGNTNSTSDLLVN